MTAVLQSYQDKLTERTANHMGYPYNLDFDYGALAGLERFSINNLGDPFIESNYGVHSREFEVRTETDFLALQCVAYVEPVRTPCNSCSPGTLTSAHAC